MLVVLVTGAIAVSFSGIFVRLSEVGPSATAFYRFLLALPFLWAWMRLDDRKPAGTGDRRRGRDVLLLALAGLFLALDLAVWHWSIVLTSVSNATLLANIAPIWVALAGWLLLGEQFTRRFLLGLVLGIAGVVLLVGGSFSLDRMHVVGDVLGLTGGILWAAYLMVIGGLRGRLPTSAVMFWGTFASCPVLLAIALASGEVLLPHSANGWLYLFGVALVCHVAGQSMIAGTLAHLPASFASVTLLLNPVSATILAWVILSEPAGLQQIIGGTIVLTGIVLARGRKADVAANGLPAATDKPA
jgi:drug/metabolite transporter (DMT)-like permease